jgi:hypothetical protein
MSSADRDLIIRYGTTEPPATGRAFECGRFSFTLENGAIRWLAWDTASGYLVEVHTQTSHPQTSSLIQQARLI